MIHEINLKSYQAVCDSPNNLLDLGTSGSYGIEQLHVTADSAWDGLVLTAVFTNGASTEVPVVSGVADVPPEATAYPTHAGRRFGRIVFKGCDAGGAVRLISNALLYTIADSGEIDGENTIAPTPDQYAQFVAEVSSEADRAEAAANRAESAGGNVTPEQIAEAVNNYLTENPVQATPIDATLTQSGQAADAKAVGDAIADIELTPGPAGANGITPTIGSNGNWYLGETDTGKPSRGEDGATGATGATGEKGTDGKSAYAYAVEGGYTGTETEFAAKLAEEMPTTLPNPNALTFTGAVTGSYDGSEPVTVEIPSGGGGAGAELLYSYVVQEDNVAIDSTSFAISPGIEAWKFVELYVKCNLIFGSGAESSGTLYASGRSICDLSYLRRKEGGKTCVFYDIKCNGENGERSTGYVSHAGHYSDYSKSLSATFDYTFQLSGTINTPNVTGSNGLIESIGFSTNDQTGFVLNSGSTVKIYGIRRSDI